MEKDAGRGYCHTRRVSTLKYVLCVGNFFTHPTSDCFAIDFP